MTTQNEKQTSSTTAGPPEGSPSASPPANAGGGAAPAGGVPGSSGTQTKVAKGIRLKLQQMLAGIQSAIPDGSDITGSNRQILTKAQAVAMLQADLALYSAVDAQQLGLVQARAQVRAQAPAIRTDYAMFRSSVELLLGKNSPLLAQFGISRKIPSALTAAQKVARAAKGKETRALRGTLGSRQKAKVVFKGEVAVTTALPHTAAPPTVAVPVQGVTPAPGLAPTAQPVAAPASASAGGSPPLVSAGAAAASPKA